MIESRYLYPHIHFLHLLFDQTYIYLPIIRSDCEGGCGGSGFQHREREVLSPPTGNSRKCPALEEVRPCETPPCPKDSLVDFMTDCGLVDPRGKNLGMYFFDVMIRLCCLFVCFSLVLFFRDS